MHPLVEASRDHFISKARRQGEASPFPSVKGRQIETKMDRRELHGITVFAGDYGSYTSRLCISMYFRMLIETCSFDDVIVIYCCFVQSSQIRMIRYVSQAGDLLSAMISAKRM